MAIHERLYVRLADPPRKRGRPPSLAMSRYGARYATKGFFTKLVYLGAFLPAIGYAFALYMGSQQEEIVLRFLAQIEPKARGAATFAEVTSDVWYRAGGALLWMLLGIQTWFAMILTPLVGSHQIADDMRSNAFEVYLARPIASWDYLLGKTLIVMRPLLTVTLGPVLIVGVLGHMLLDGSFSACWPLYPRVAVAVVLWALFNALIILGISSTGKSSRYATIIWFVLTVGSFLAGAILIEATNQPHFDLVSYPNNLHVLLMEAVEFQPFSGMEMAFVEWERGIWPSLGILGGLSAIGAWLVLRRVRSGRLP